VSHSAKKIQARDWDEAAQAVIELPEPRWTISANGGGANGQIGRDIAALMPAEITYRLPAAADLALRSARVL
jgi:hypothetical protein